MKRLLKHALNLLLISITFGQTQTDITNISLDSLLNIKINTASKYLQTSAEAPASVTIITSKDIESFGFETLDEVLLSVRGYYISNDRNYTYLGIRGFSRPSDYNNRILIQLNGHTLNENVYGSAFIEAALGVNLNSVERIEIVRGPGSAVYGTGAMFSVINIITKTGAQQDYRNLELAVGSYGKKSSSFYLGTELENGIDLFFSGALGQSDGQDHYYKELHNPEVNNGISSGMDWERYIGFQTRIAYRYLTIQAMHTYRRKAIPTGSYSAALNEINETHDGNTFLELSYKNNIAYNKELTIKGHYQDYIYEGIYFTDELGFDATDNLRADAEAQLQWDILTTNRLVTGIEYQTHFVADYRMWNTENTYFNGNYPYSIFSAYMTDQWSVTNNLNLHLGFRFDHYSKIGNYVVPRLAAIYNPFSNTTIKLLYGAAFRRPNIYEFYYEDSGVQKANLSLASEKIQTAEFIIEQKLSKSLIGLFTLYNNNIADLIDPVIDPADSMIQFQNISEVKSSGIELEFNYFPKTNIRFFASYIYQLSENDITDNQISNSPSQICKLGVVLPLYNILTAGFNLYYETSRITLNGNTTDAHLLANLNLSSSKLFDIAILSFKINNIFNTTYYNPAGFEHLQYAIKQNGRNYTLKVNVSF